MVKIVIAAAVLGVAFLVLPSSNAVVCTKDICSMVRCKTVTPESCKANGQEFRKNGGFCGCCDLCVTIIKNGGHCLNLRGTPPTEVCEEGSVCKNNTCVPAACLSTSESSSSEE